MTHIFRDKQWNTYRITVSGIVQGVGFRPFIYNSAKEYGITGFVINSSIGVEITVNTSLSQLKAFIQHIEQAAPPLSHISQIDYQTVDKQAYDNFSIQTSAPSAGITLVSPDTAICRDCTSELFDKNDTRYQYPFINCTNCGPRYSIIESIPYDRPATTMKAFDMCPDCKNEYKDPTNRRFHAQPNCCPVCGPTVTYNDLSGIEAIKTIANKIDNGDIVAIKGLGGYHLICDAMNAHSVTTLRKLKNRPSKPLAVMCQNIDTTSKHGLAFSPAEEHLFSSPSSPIVIFDWDNHPLSSQINPINNRIGIMHAYTPLHQLLLNELKTDFIVATSGNIKDEPICTNSIEAEKKLSIYTNHFLHHNRDIHIGIDDSVSTTVNNAPYLLRRARGFAPYPVMLPKKLKSCVIGLGAHLKSTITIGIDNYAFVSQYIGDLDNPETVNFYVKIIDKMKLLFHVEPTTMITDQHPGYHSSVYASKQTLPIYTVQHHHAHMYACMAENNLTDNVIGVIFDGTGLGNDNAIWGGEFFIKQGDILRTHHLKYVKQPGMDGAAKNPYRMVISYLYAYDLLDDNVEILINTFGITENEIVLLKNMMDKNINSINTSSMGRLFEAVGSLLSGIKTNEYEGHAAITLESMATADTDDHYPIEIANNVICLSTLFSHLLNDISENIPNHIIATKFHNSIAQLIVNTCRSLSAEHGITDIVLSGGVFQNITLLEKTLSKLKKADLIPHIHSKVPANDGCISLGQVYAYTISQLSYTK